MLRAANGSVVIVAIRLVFEVKICDRIKTRSNVLVVKPLSADVQPPKGPRVTETAIV